MHAFLSFGRFFGPQDCKSWIYLDSEFYGEDRMLPYVQFGGHTGRMLSDKILNLFNREMDGDKHHWNALLWW